MTPNEKDKRRKSFFLNVRRIFINFLVATGKYYARDIWPYVKIEVKTYLTIPFSKEEKTHSLLKFHLPNLRWSVVKWNWE